MFFCREGPVLFCQSNIRLHFPRKYRWRHTRAVVPQVKPVVIQMPQQPMALMRVKTLE